MDSYRRMPFLMLDLQALNALGIDLQELIEGDILDVRHRQNPRVRQFFRDPIRLQILWAVTAHHQI
jgi:hypothetical protein